MAEIVPFPEPISPHVSGPVMCLACRHRWVAVTPVGQDSLGLECPACGLNKGERAYALMPAQGEPIWKCHCGSVFLYAQPKGIFCVNCGCKNEPY